MPNLCDYSSSNGVHCQLASGHLGVHHANDEQIAPQHMRNFQDYPSEPCGHSTAFTTCLICYGELLTAKKRLLTICEEIANDSRIDLVESERRIRLYSAIHDAGGMQTRQTCGDCGRPLDGKNCVAGGVHDIPKGEI